MSTKIDSLDLAMRDLHARLLAEGRTEDAETIDRMAWAIASAETYATVSRLRAEVRPDWVERLQARGVAVERAEMGERPHELVQTPPATPGCPDCDPDAGEHCPMHRLLSGTPAEILERGFALALATLESEEAVRAYAALFYADDPDFDAEATARRSLSTITRVISHTVGEGKGGPLRWVRRPLEEAPGQS